MRLCKDCRWLRQDDVSETINEIRRMFGKESIDTPRIRLDCIVNPVGLKNPMIDPFKARAPTGICGPDAAYFEPKEDNAS